MRKYETIVITNPDLDKALRKTFFERVEEIIVQEGGVLIRFNDWGVKKLAYEIKKKVRGDYTLIDYCGAGAVVDEMERFFRIDDRALKFMTVLLEKEADMEAVQAEIEADQAKQVEKDRQAAAEEKKAAPDAAAEKAEVAEADASSTESTETSPDEEEAK
ncbi:30S ribosomal protein S6 [Desulfonema ishimotonii]|uniref:Small ribosomal subunit protein bS6 n=1 Tax=Desulfonema ishimotonii TaxID=45657 RepID=A0A401FPZ1_9BACT|nr:30S ribosomal protein S6 [Desulfonema ishimotonii]GBC59079.1 30S ribosomal protein S6 [Desulfonema ishimotonii]